MSLEFGLCSLSYSAKKTYKVVISQSRACLTCFFDLYVLVLYKRHSAVSFTQETNSMQHLITHPEHCANAFLSLSLWA